MDACLTVITNKVSALAGHTSLDTKSYLTLNYYTYGLQCDGLGFSYQIEFIR